MSEFTYLDPEDKDFKSEVISKLSEHIKQSSDDYARFVAQALYETHVPITDDNLSKLTKEILNKYYLPSATMACNVIKSELRLIALEIGIVLYTDEIPVLNEIRKAIILDNKTRDMGEEIMFEERSRCVNPYCYQQGMVIEEVEHDGYKHLHYYCLKCHVTYHWVSEKINKEVLK